MGEWEAKMNEGAKKIEPKALERRTKNKIDKRYTVCFECGKHCKPGDVKVIARYICGECYDRLKKLGLVTE